MYNLFGGNFFTASIKLSGFKQFDSKSKFGWFLENHSIICNASGCNKNSPPSKPIAVSFDMALLFMISLIFSKERYFTGRFAQILQCLHRESHKSVAYIIKVANLRGPMLDLLFTNFFALLT